jgi:NADPH2:quinone reductase
VREITGRRGVRVVYDGVGKDTFAGSLDCLQPRGLLVMFGQSSGMVPPFDLAALSVKGSLYVTRPTLGTYAATPETLRRMASDLFGVIRSGAVRILPPQQFALREAGAAHTALESRATTGSIVLVA